MLPIEARTNRFRRCSLAALVGLALAVPVASAEASSGGIGPGGPPKSGGAGTIDGVSPSYAKFSHLVSQGTDLSLRVIGAWTLAEGGPSDNPLNIGPGERYGSVRAGARATSNLLGDSLYRNVLASAREPDRKQIKAIADSSWCPGCSGYEGLLRRTYRSVTVRP